MASDPAPGRLAKASLSVGVLALLGGLLAEVFGVSVDDHFGNDQRAACLLGALLIAVGWQQLGRDHPWRVQARAVRQQSPPMTLGSAVWLALWFGLWAGHFENLHQVVRRFAFDVTLRCSAHAAWMAPVVYCAFFLPIAVALGIAGRLWPSLARQGLWWVGATAVLVWTQLSIYPVVDGGAALILGVALGVQAARWAARHAAHVLPAVRRSALGMAAVTLASYPAISAWQGIAEARARAALPRPPEHARNVLMLVLDTARADRLSLLGAPRPTTPVLDQLAKRGVVFEHCASTAPWTLPAHASLFTGLYPSQHGADYTTPMHRAAKTLAEALAEHGYATCGIVGNLGYCSSDWGIARGFQHYVDFRDNVASALWATAIGRRFAPGAKFVDKVRNDAGTVAAEFYQWVDAVPRERPFFAFLNFFDAHSLYLPPKPFDTMFGPRSPHLEEWLDRKWSAAEVGPFVDAYDACLRYIDTEIGAVLAHLASAGRLDDTLVVVVADHGEHFGEHGYFDHGNSLYMELLHVPLLMVLPGTVPSGQRVGEWVTLRDVPASVLDLVGAPAALPGRSLAACWRPGAALASPVLSQVSQGIRRPATDVTSLGDMDSLIQGNLQMILRGDGAVELYDLAADPRQQNDLAKQAEWGERVQKMRAELEAASSTVRTPAAR